MIPHPEACVADPDDPVVVAPADPETDLVQSAPEPIRASKQWPALCVLAGDCHFQLGQIEDAEKAYRGYLLGGMP